MALYQSKFGYRPKKFGYNYKDDNPTFTGESEEEKEQRRELERQQAKTRPRVVNQQQAQQQTQQAQQAGFRDVPEAYDENGNLKERYNTSKGQDFLAGLGRGAKLGQGGDPFFQFGATLGGGIAGLFNKNIAGRDIYNQDLAETQQYNEQIVFKTNAQVRIDEEKRKKIEGENRQKILESRELRAIRALDAKDAVQRRKNLEYNIEEAIAQGDVEDRIKYQRELASMNGWADLEDIPETYGVDMGDIMQKGNFTYQMSKNGKVIRQAVDEKGNPLTSFTIEDWIRIAKQAKSTKFDENIARSSYDRAVAFVDKLENSKPPKVNFTTPTGKRNNSQRNAYIQRIADQMYEGEVSGKIPSTIDIGDTSYSYEDNRLTSTTTNTTDKGSSDINPFTDAGVVSTTIEPLSVDVYKSKGITDPLAISNANKFFDKTEIDREIANLRKSSNPRAEVMIKALELRKEKLGGQVSEEDREVLTAKEYTANVNGVQKTVKGVMTKGLRVSEKEKEKGQAVRTIDGKSVIFIYDEDDKIWRRIEQ